MIELFRMVEEPRRCSYLPYETASLEVRVVKDMSASASPRKAEEELGQQKVETWKVER